MLYTWQTLVVPYTLSTFQMSGFLYNSQKVKPLAGHLSFAVYIYTVYIIQFYML